MDGLNKMLEEHKVNSGNLSKADDILINLSVLLMQTSDTITKAIELELAQYNVNFPEARILFMLARENRDVNFHEMSEWVLRELNSISVLVTKMESKGLVKKIKKPGDKRTYVILTEKGADLFNNQITEKAQKMIFNALKDDERQQFERLLKTLRDRARNLLGMDYKPPFLP